jgi:pimeloyl-ACP methyl ester carboxylesterase
MSFPFWSQAFFDGLVSPASIRYFLKKSFQGPLDRGLVQYAYETSHRPGARFAPLHFIAGRLFIPGVLERVYASVTVPALVLYDRDAYVSFERLNGLVRSNPNWREERIPGTRGLPHFERLDATAAALERFWEGVETGAPQPAALPAS